MRNVRLVFAMDIDETKSLAQLTGIDWGIAPPGAGSLVRERHEFRKTALDKLPISALKLLISLDFQEDCTYLIPYALRRMAAPPPSGAEELSEHCNLLLGVLLNERYDWLQRPVLVPQVRQMVESECYALYCASSEAEQTSDHMAYYKVLLPNTQVQASLYEALVYRIIIKGTYS